jgi:hypothetical protein
MGGVMRTLVPVNVTVGKIGKKTIRGYRLSVQNDHCLLVATDKHVSSLNTHKIVLPRREEDIIKLVEFILKHTVGPLSRQAVLASLGVSDAANQT